MKRLLLLLLMTPVILKSQQNKADSSLVVPQGVSFHFQNANFVKDNEYFNNVVEGYTLMGLWITPTLSYNISDKATIEGGFHALKFSGRNKIYDILPVYRIDYKIFNPLLFTIGTLHFNDNHLMPAPMLDPERFYFNQVENGAQFLFNSKMVKSDLWISWDHFIWYGDSAQERITAGLAVHLDIPLNDNFHIKVPIDFIATHQGGQINRPKKAMETLTNFSNGLSANINLDLGFIKEIELGSKVLFYNQKTTADLRPFRSGYALLPEIIFKSDGLSLGFSYWYSNKFIGPRGEAMYQCQSTLPDKPDLVYKTRKFGIVKLNYNKEITKALDFKCGFEGYNITDQEKKVFDYNFTVAFVCQVDKLLGNAKLLK